MQYKYPEETITSIVAEEALQYGLFDTFDVPFPPTENPKFKFIDLFAGIGGFRLAMQNVGGKCIYTSEWEPYAKKTYKANFGEIPFGDITKEKTKDYIPSGFDILCAGFPCQLFSIAGEIVKDFLIQEEHCFSILNKSLKNTNPKSFFWKMLKT